MIGKIAFAFGCIFAAAIAKGLTTGEISMSPVEGGFFIAGLVLLAWSGFVQFRR